MHWHRYEVVGEPTYFRDELDRQCWWLWLRCRKCGREKIEWQGINP